MVAWAVKCKFKSVPNNYFFGPVLIFKYFALSLIFLSAIRFSTILGYAIKSFPKAKKSEISTCNGSCLFTYVGNLGTPDAYLVRIHLALTSVKKITKKDHIGVKLKLRFNRIISFII